MTHHRKKNRWRTAFLGLFFTSCYFLQAGLTVTLTLLPATSAHASCEWPPTDEPDDDGDECYSAPDAPKNLGASGADTNCPICQAGQSSGNPINNTTGNKFETQVDYAGAGVLPLTLLRHYNSLSTTNSGALGANWTHNYSARLKILSKTSVQLIRADQQTLTFTLSNGVWSADADVNSHLTQQAKGWSYTTGADTVEQYTGGGYLTSIATRSGLTTTLVYDSKTRLSKVTDPFGHQLSFAYDANNRIASITLPNKGVLAYGYDVASNLATVTYPDGKSRQYVYENASYPHALTGIVDENGNRYATYSYDGNGIAVSSEHAGGVGKVTLSYDFNNGATNVTDALGNTRTYAYQTLYGIARTITASQPCADCGNNDVTYKAYDANGNVNWQQDFNGNTTNIAYDLSRNLETSRTDANGNTISTKWHPTFHLPVQVAQRGQVLNWQYDSLGNVIAKSITDTATGQVRTWTTSYTYDSKVPSAIVKKVEDGPSTTVSDVTTTLYYAPNATCTGGTTYCRGQISQIIDALGHTTNISSYNADGQPLTSSNPNKLASTFTYDKRQHLTSYNIGGLTTQLQYDNVGQLLRITRPDNSKLLYSYDQAHQLIKMQDSLGNSVAYTLDLMGNRTAVTILDASNNSTFSHSYSYDSQNRLVSETGASGQTKTYNYDNQGNLTSLADPLDQQTYLYYDSLNRLSQTTDPTGSTTRFQRDARGNITAVVDPNNNSTQYAWDGFDEKTNETSPDRGVLAYNYDKGFKLTASTDARMVQQNLTYDALNRPLALTYNTVNGIPAVNGVNWTYDTGTFGIGHLTGITDNSGSTSFSYDQQGRLLSKAQTTTANNNSITHTVTYSYDSAGRLKSQTTPAGLLIAYGYNANGQINSISVNGKTVLSNLLYQPFGAPKSWKWGNGSSYARSFDTDGRLSDYPVANLVRHLTYDAAGRITGYTTGNAIRSFQYDGADRLTGYTAGKNQVNNYQYDANGNRTGNDVNSTHHSYTTDTASNRLLSVSGSTKKYNYDNAGNPLKDGTNSFVWGADGRMFSGSNSKALFSYTFNGLGQRVIKSSSLLGNGPIRFVYDPDGHLMGEYDANNTLIQETIWLGDTPVAVVKNDPSVGQLATYYIHSDHLNTPQVILNSKNVPVWRADGIDAFGVGTVAEDPDGNGVKFTYNLRFPGQYYDAETGLNYNYFRDYDPSVGRYIESDPIGLVGGLNTYAYVGGNPVSYTDSRGECPWCIAFALGVYFTAEQANAPSVSDHTYSTSPLDYFENGLLAATLLVGEGLFAGKCAANVVKDAVSVFGENDLVYGASANGALRNLQEQAGGKLLSDFAAGPGELSWADYSISIMEQQVANNGVIRFDLTNISDIQGVLGATGQYSGTITAQELRYIQANWNRFNGSVYFYNSRKLVAAPW